MRDYTDEMDGVCPDCHVGLMHFVKRPLLRVDGQYLFTIPRAAAYRCDFCDYFEYDEGLLDMMNKMILKVRQTQHNLSRNEAVDNVQSHHGNMPQV